jgi:SAM-dependent methyltransferase
MSVTKVKRTARKSLSRAAGRACRLLGERRVAAVFSDWFRADPDYAKRLLSVCLRTMPHMASVDDRTLIDILRLWADAQDWPFDASRPIGEQHVATVFSDWFRADPDYARRLLSACLGTIPDMVPLQDRTLIDILRLRADGQDSPFYSHHVYSEMAGCARRHGHETTRVLEIGPGSSLGALTCFLAAGSERAAGADIEPLHGDRATFYEDLKRYLAVVEGFRWWRNYASTDSDPKHSYPACWDHVDLSALATQIDYRAPAPSHSLPFPASCFDFIYSVAVLEHVENPAGTIAELRRVLQPDGLTTHEIDLRYHGPNDLLKLLRWPEDEYRAMTQRYGEGRGIDSILDGTWKGEVYCNRLRLSDWLELFRGHNFEILEVEPLCIIAEDQLRREELHAPFDRKSSKDLAVVQVRITARPTSGGSPSSAENGV